MRLISLVRKSRPKTTGYNGEPASAAVIRDTLPAPAARSRQTRERAIGYGGELLPALAESLGQGDLVTLEALWELLQFCTDVVATVDTATRLADAPAHHHGEGLIPSIPTYTMSSRFLYRCHTFLVGDVHGRERMHLVTGIKLGENAYTLDSLEKVTLSHQSRGGAKADQLALNRALIDLDTFGHHLLGLFHRHPGSGIHATHPSAIDLDTHKRLEDGGYPVIGCIVVQDGYLRFFQSTTELFGIRIYGKGVEQVPGEKNVFKIQTPEARCVSYETFETEQGG
jgi:hypothetical protein